MYITGYFLQNKITGGMLAELINTALHSCKSSELRVRGVAFDGASTNFSALNTLGCNFNGGSYNDIVTKFESGEAEHPIHAIPDACHMLKLARNSLATLGAFKVNDQLIEWKYIDQLHTMQNEIGLKFANKLSKTHIEWQKNKMKVKLAAQTLSSSVADALQFLLDAGVPEFKECGPTIEFIRKIDRLFDFLNGRNPFGKGFKKPIYGDNIGFLKRMIIPIVEYLFTLCEPNGTPLYRGIRKTFVIGFTAAVRSVFSIAEELLLCPNSYFKYLLTYRFSQDHIELLLSRIRKRFGNNNNPTVREFKMAMKQILMKNSISASSSGNCIAMDGHICGGIFDIKWPKKNAEPLTCNNDNIMDAEEDVNEDEILDQVDQLIIDSGNSDLQAIATNNILYYISGFIVRKILKKISCIECIEKLLRKKSDHDYCSNNPAFKFLNMKDRGGLIHPSHDVFKVVQRTNDEMKIRTKHFTNLSEPMLASKISNAVTRRCIGQVFQTGTVCSEENFGESHEIILVKLISEFFIKIRFHALARNKNNSDVSKRHKLRKTIDIILHQ